MKIVVNLTSVPFVLGLIVELEDCYIVTSNRESGFGRYDVMLEPRDKCEDAYKKYAATLEARGIPEEKIHKYAFAFCGKHVLIGKSTTGDK